MAKKGNVGAFKGAQMSGMLAQVSKNERQMIAGYEGFDAKIRKFVWEGRVGGKKRAHTQEEYDTFLVELSKELWNMHTKGLNGVINSVAKPIEI